MRRLLLLAIATLVALPFFGQDNSEVLPKEPTKHTYQTKSVQTYQSLLPEDGEPLVELYYQTFDNGIPSEWVNEGFDGTGSPLPNALWEYRGPNTSPTNDTGSLGAYADPENTIISPTLSDGFIIFDSDYLDNFGVQGNFGNGPAPAPHVGTLQTDTFDLSANPDVVLSFNSYHRYFEGRALLTASPDAGATWPDTFLVHDLAVNADNANDDRVTFDLSNLIGGSSQALIKFVFDGTFDDPGATGSGQGYYFWMIDDIRLIEKPSNELALSDYLLSTSGLNNLDTRGINYGQIPSNQGGMLEALAVIENSGVNTQTNAVSTLYVRDQNQNLFTNQSQAYTLMSDSFEIAENAIDLSTLGMGAYSISLSVTSDSLFDTDPRGIRPSVDSIASNNILQITDSVYAVDNGYADRELGSEYAGGDAQDGARFANALVIREADHLTAVRINLGPGTVPGGDIFIEVKDTLPTFATAFDANAGGDWTNVVLKSNPYRITDQDTTNGYAMVEIPQVLTGGQVQDRELQPNLYYVSVSMFSNTGANPITIWDDNTSQQSFSSTIYYYYPNGRWYSDGNAMHIRPIFGDIFIGVDEVEGIGNLSIHPNPASTNVSLKLEADLVANYQVVITNISGKIIKQVSFSNTDNIVTNFDISDLSSGIYAVQVKSENGMVTKKLVITK